MRDRGRASGPPGAPGVPPTDASRGHPPAAQPLAPTLPAEPVIEGASIGSEEIVRWKSAPPPPIETRSPPGQAPPLAGPPGRSGSTAVGIGPDEEPEPFDDEDGAQTVAIEAAPDPLDAPTTMQVMPTPLAVEAAQRAARAAPPPPAVAAPAPEPPAAPPAPAAAPPAVAASAPEPPAAPAAPEHRPIEADRAPAVGAVAPDDTQGGGNRDGPRPDEPAEPSPPAQLEPGGGAASVAQHISAPGGPLPLPFVEQPDSPLTASYRVLRHRLREVDNPAVIAVSSANPGEGKTTCAINLAMSLAEHSRDPVLLLEANFRAPKVCEALGFTPPRCFGEQQQAHADSPGSAWLVVSVAYPNLHVLAVDPRSVGRWGINARTFRQTMEQLKVAYPQIVIDCPTALGSADVNIIEDSSDGVLLVARARQTSAKSLRSAARHLSPATIFGVVLLGGR